MLHAVVAAVTHPDHVCGRTDRRRQPADVPSASYRFSRRPQLIDSDTGERLTPVLDFPSRDGLAVQALRVDYEPGGFTRGTHQHPAGAYVYVIEGSVIFGLDDREPVVLKAGESFYEPPGALHSVSRNASEDLPASLIAFFVLGEGEAATVYDRD
jgi:quercetin dioxygenase-like cupin family protein